MTMTESEKEQQKQQQAQSSQEYVSKKKAPFIKKKTPRNNNNDYYNANPTSRYYNTGYNISSNMMETLPPYPMPYIYYPPPSVFYPATTQQNHAREEEELSIILHDENISSVDNSRRSDSNKSLDLKKQLEYYFSRQNLVNDTYLVSQMDKDLYVPISVIANFKRVREWTLDLEVIKKTLSEIPSVTLNEDQTKVKPNISVERKTVIWRDVPDCTREEIDQLLKELDSPPVEEIKQDIGNMWYFTFATEQDAIKLLLGVRGKSFKDQAIAARMKSEPVLRVQTTPIEKNATTVMDYPSPPPMTQHIPPAPIVYPYNTGYNYPPANYTAFPKRGGYQNNNSTRPPPNYNNKKYYNNSNYNNNNTRYDGQHTYQTTSRSPRGFKQTNKYLNNENSSSTFEPVDDLNNPSTQETRPPRHQNQQQQQQHHTNSKRPFTKTNASSHTSTRSYSNYSKKVEEPIKEDKVEENTTATSDTSTPEKSFQPNQKTYKKKENITGNARIRNKTNSSQSYQSNSNHNKKKKGGPKEETKNPPQDLKPSSFPPLPGNVNLANETTVVDVSKRSVADIVKSNQKNSSESTNKKSIESHTEETTNVSTAKEIPPPPQEEERKPIEKQVPPSFSYADVLKKKEQQSQQ